MVDDKQKAYYKEYYLKNRERILETRKKREYSKKYYNKNKEHLRAINKAYYWKNRARQLMLCKQWRERQRLKEMEQRKIPPFSKEEGDTVFILNIT